MLTCLTSSHSVISFIKIYTTTLTCPSSSHSSATLNNLFQTSFPLNLSIVLHYSYIMLGLHTISHNWTNYLISLVLENPSSHTRSQHKNHIVASQRTKTCVDLTLQLTLELTLDRLEDRWYQTKVGHNSILKRLRVYQPINDKTWLDWANTFS